MIPIPKLKTKEERRAEVVWNWDGDLNPYLEVNPKMLKKRKGE
ncbi:MAG: hypothetical protein AAF757_32225 [Cyanobacteria bacterium P01_D01_bin.116]